VLHRPTSLALALVLPLSPVGVRAGELAEAATSAPSAASTAPTPGSLPTDDRGRPFPDPRLVRRANAWIAGGAAMAGVGAAGLVAGLFTGSAMARGEIEDPVEARVGAVALLAGGVFLAFSGVPLISAGRHTRGQLLRTIRGVEKVPRTVANEQRYWDTYLAHERAQALALGGGGMVMLGIVNVVAVAALVGTEVYDARYWWSAAGTLSAGGVMLAVGLLEEHKTKAHLASIRKEVLGPGAASLPPPPVPFLAWDAAGTVAPRLGLAWAGRF
jgi:hypothetical protein